MTQRIARSTDKPRLLTGDRPTGRLHLGHYVGSLANRVALQEEHESYFIVADLHMLTTRNEREDIERITERARAMVLDSISAGIDPERVTFYLQSGVPEVCILNTLFQSLVTVPRLERIPSLKEMARSAGRAEMSYALLGYPVLQAADVLCVRADAVPVGKDNQAHISTLTGSRWIPGQPRPVEARSGRHQAPAPLTCGHGLAFPHPRSRRTRRAPTSTRFGTCPTIW